MYREIQYQSENGEWHSLDVWDIIDPSDDTCIKLRNRIAELEAETQKYIYLANLVDGFVAITPEHKLYESIRQDVISCLKELKGCE